MSSIKKIFSILLVLTALAYASSIHAEVGNDCTRGYGCDTSALQPTPCVDIQGTGACGSTSQQTTPLGTGASAPITTQGFVPLENIKGLYLDGASHRGFSDVLNTIFRFGLGIAALLAVLMITWGGFQYMLNDTNLTSKEEGRDRITSAIYGLLIILLSYILLVTINPQIARTNTLFSSSGLPASTPPPPPPPSAPGNSFTDRVGQALTPKLYINEMCPPTDGTCDTISRTPPPPANATKVAPGSWCPVTGAGSTVYVRYADTKSCEASCSNPTYCVLPPSIDVVNASNNALFPTSAGATCTLVRGQTFDNEVGKPESQLEVTSRSFASYDECTAKCPATPGGWQETICTSEAAF